MNELRVFLLHEYEKQQRLASLPSHVTPKKAIWGRCCNLKPWQLHGPLGVLK